MVQYKWLAFLLLYTILMIGLMASGTTIQRNIILYWIGTYLAEVAKNK